MLRFVFGEPAATVREEAGAVRVGVPCPVISGPREELYRFGAATFSAGDDTVCADCGDTRVVAMTVLLPADAVERAARGLYDELFRLTRDLHLYRVWHFVPDILGRPDGREETYRRFCEARAEAFDAAFDAEAERRMSAASATGCDGDRLVVVAVAGTAVPEYFENPGQTPAYRYPAKYGPRPPSFARASRVKLESGEWVFVSGTAAVAGSDSLHAGDLAAQIGLTRDNLDCMVSLAAGNRTPAAAASRVYLKAGVAAPDLAVFAVAGASPTVLRSDVCRDELLVEAELTLRFDA